MASLQRSRSSLRGGCDDAQMQADDMGGIRAYMARMLDIAPQAVASAASQRRRTPPKLKANSRLTQPTMASVMRSLDTDENAQVLHTLSNRMAAGDATKCKLQLQRGGAVIGGSSGKKQKKKKSKKTKKTEDGGSGLKKKGGGKKQRKMRADEFCLTTPSKGAKSRSSSSRVKLSLTSR
jgi:hypothetical protein